MFWIALAAQLSAPVPINLERWFSNEDVPTYLVEKGSGLWPVGIKANVAPDGTVQNCEVEKSSHIAGLDKLTCAIVFRRAKFHPARSVDGSAAFGAYRDSVWWSVGAATSEEPFASIPDLDVFVQNLPSGIKSPALVRVMFAVDQTGNKNGCVADTGPSLQKINNNPSLVSVACEQVMTTYTATPARDSSSSAVPSVPDALVRFTVKQQ